MLVDPYPDSFDKQIQTKIYTQTFRNFSLNLGFGGKHRKGKRRKNDALILHILPFDVCFSPNSKS
jgi:hypothetical protein